LFFNSGMEHLDYLVLRCSLCPWVPPPAWYGATHQKGTAALVSPKEREHLLLPLFPFFVALALVIVELRVERREGLPSVIHIDIEPTADSVELVDALALAANAGTDCPTWVHGSSDPHDQIMSEHGYESSRTLLQMRMPLPTTNSGMTTRAFTEADIDEFVAVNNRAFDWHPEQSGLTEASVRADMAQPWVDAEGFRLHHIDGRLAGFCWTKEHQQPERLGEIYVIALDPDFAGQGLGKPMTLAGLDHLSAQGHDTAMLYVESDNTAAVATYEKLGFATHRSDKLWRAT